MQLTTEQHLCEMREYFNDRIELPSTLAEKISDHKLAASVVSVIISALKFDQRVSTITSELSVAPVYLQPLVLTLIQELTLIGAEKGSPLATRITQEIVAFIKKEFVLAQAEVLKLIIKQDEAVASAPQEYHAASQQIRNAFEQMGSNQNEFKRIAGLIPDEFKQASIYVLGYFNDHPDEIVLEPSQA